MKKQRALLLYDYTLLAARVWMAYILISYGWAKLSGNQFGITQAELDTPVRNLNLFRLSWYLADHEPFRSFIAVSQIVTGILLSLRRTCVIGALMSLPIWLNILIWDMTFLGAFGSVFTVRLSWYLLLTVLVLLHQRRRVFPSLQLITSYDKPDIRYPLWAYLLLPVAGFLIEFLPGIPQMFCYVTGQIGLF